MVANPVLLMFVVPGALSAIVAIWAIGMPSGAPEWFILSSAVFCFMGFATGCMGSIKRALSHRAYSQETIGFPEASRALGESERLVFQSGQSFSVAGFFVLAALAALAFPGMPVLAPILVLVLTPAFVVVPFTFSVARAPDAVLLSFIPASAFSGFDGSFKPVGREAAFSVGWRFAPRLEAARFVGAHGGATLAPAIADIMAALDSGARLRPDLSGLVRDFGGYAGLRLRGLWPVMPVAVTVAILTWLIAVILPRPMLPALPAPLELWETLRELSDTASDDDVQENPSDSMEHGSSQSDAGGSGSPGDGVRGAGQSGAAGPSGSSQSDAGGSGSSGDGAGGSGSPGDGAGGTGQSGAAGSSGSSQSDAGGSGSSGDGAGGSGSLGDGAGGIGQSGDAGSSGSSQSDAGGSGSPGDGAGGAGQSGDAGSSGSFQSDAGGSGLSGDGAGGAGQSGDAGSSGSSQSDAGGSGSSGDGAGGSGQSGAAGSSAAPESAGGSGPLVGQDAPVEPPTASGIGSQDQATAREMTTRGSGMAGSDVAEPQTVDGSATPGAMSGERQAPGGPVIPDQTTPVAGTGPEADIEARMLVPTAPSTGEDLAIGLRGPPFAGRGQAPALIEDRLGHEPESFMPESPPRPARQRVPAWIAEILN
ncbi:Endoglucanase (plasmid) [Rhodovulum sp. P5]|nr:Endoglucanase [Rhodovulum sp. P5]